MGDYLFSFGTSLGGDHFLPSEMVPMSPFSKKKIAVVAIHGLTIPVKTPWILDSR